MNVAFIPVRGGSKSIPLKNIKMICGKPLVYWVVKAACECEYIDKVYVSTDNEKIRNTVINFQNKSNIMNIKVEVIERSEESASDTASTESAMLEFAKKYEFENIVLIQATSPLLKSNDLNRGFISFNNEHVDSVLSVVRQKRFIWKEDVNSFYNAMNYDIFKRPRRQEFEGYLVENGAFYITSKKALLKTKNRISGNIKVIEMDENSFLEIDEPSDWEIIEGIMLREKIRKNDVVPIKMFLTDCDGCLTDAGMYYSENGDELKKFNSKDGMGFKILREYGIITGIITGEDRKLNKRRAEKLHLDILEDGCEDKVTAIKMYCDKRGINLKNVCYIGDDINDIEALKVVGFSCCPQDAVDKVKSIVDFVAKSKGGEGVIREVVEQLLKLGAIK